MQTCQVKTRKDLSLCLIDIEKGCVLALTQSCLCDINILTGTAILVMAIKHSILLDWRQQLSDTHAKPVRIFLKSNRSYIVAKGASFEMVVLQQKLVFLHSHFLLQHPVCVSFKLVAL